MWAWFFMGICLASALQANKHVQILEKLIKELEINVSLTEQMVKAKQVRLEACEELNELQKQHIEKHEKHVAELDKQQEGREE